MRYVKQADGSERANFPVEVWLTKGQVKYLTLAARELGHKGDLQRFLTNILADKILSLLDEGAE